MCQVQVDGFSQSCFGIWPMAMWSIEDAGVNKEDIICMNLRKKSGKTKLWFGIDSNPLQVFFGFF